MFKHRQPYLGIMQDNTFHQTIDIFIYPFHFLFQVHPGSFEGVLILMSVITFGALLSSTQTLRGENIVSNFRAQRIINTNFKYVHSSPVYC